MKSINHSPSATIAAEQFLTDRIQQGLCPTREEIHDHVVREFGLDARDNWGSEIDSAIVSIRRHLENTGQRKGLSWFNSVYPSQGVSK